MKHFVTVGIPTRKGDKITGHTDVQKVPSNEAFRYMRRGFVTLAETSPAAKKAADKTAAATKKAADNDENGEDLNKLTVKELRIIAEPLGASGRIKADLIESIEQARQGA